MYIKRKLYSTYEDEYGEERLYSTSEFLSEETYLEDLEQREFGAVKAANKAATRAWREAQGTRKGFFGYGKRTGDEAVRAARQKAQNNLMNSQATLTSGKYKDLNHKINAKGVIEPSNRYRNPYDVALNRGQKINRGSKPSNHSVYRDGNKEDWQAELRQANSLKYKR